MWVRWRFTLDCRTRIDSASLVSNPRSNWAGILPISKLSHTIKILHGSVEGNVVDILSLKHGNLAAIIRPIITATHIPRIVTSAFSPPSSYNWSSFTEATIWIFSELVRFTTSKRGLNIASKIAGVTALWLRSYFSTQLSPSDGFFQRFTDSVSLSPQAKFTYWI